MLRTQTVYRVVWLKVIFTHFPQSSEWISLATVSQMAGPHGGPSVNVLGMLDLRQHLPALPKMPVPPKWHRNSIAKALKRPKRLGISELTSIDWWWEETVPFVSPRPLEAMTLDLCATPMNAGNGGRQKKITGENEKGISRVTEL